MRESDGVRDLRERAVERAGRPADIDWTAIDASTTSTGARSADARSQGRIDLGDAEGDGDDQRSRPLDGPTLLTPGDLERLDPSRERVAITELYPDRVRPPTEAQRCGVTDAWNRDRGLASWIGEINAEWTTDARQGLVGHTENCADCARAVQETWDGRPTAAGSIASDGLPLQGGRGGGEHPAYTEQWAARRAETSSYDEIGDRVAASRGSAIVFAHGDVGHAINALWEPQQGRVIWADGQTGELGDWPPEHLRVQLPDTQAIFFPEPRSPR